MYIGTRRWAEKMGTERYNKRSEKKRRVSRSKTGDNKNGQRDIKFEGKR